MRLVAVILVLAASAAHADPMKSTAREHFDRSTTLYKSGDYAAAIGELELGQKLDPHPHFHYALGQAYRKLGDCKSAVQHYVAFLETHPSESETTHAKKNIARCPAETEPKPVVTPVRAPTLPTDEPPTAPTAPTALIDEPSRGPIAIARSERPTSAWYTDVPGGVLAGAGLGGLAVGVSYLVLADRDIAAANAAKPIAKLQQLAATGHHERTIGAIGLIAGSALAIGAAVRYVMVAREHNTPNHVVSVAVDRTGVYAVWTGSF